MLRVLHIALLLGVMLGLTLPKTSAALADMGLIDDGFVVICTGHGLERVSLAQIDPRPQPPSDEHDAHCLLVHALDHATPADQPLWLRIARSFPRLDAAPPALPSHPPLLAQARAPPAG
ncbi:DUF2946 family protein [Paracoccus zeaxanthinifaciens]|uniref:DUF2946 family protein n=1 Tax=Paracoccus zeaxanthinifaciens TaxID=187400 RepID=UPI0003B76887|nr:DUF2946 family protein [Paracoccus zeaxanthinifaciens]